MSMPDPANPGPPSHPFLLHGAGGAPVLIPPGASHLYVGRERLGLYADDATRPIDCQAQLSRDDASVRLTSAAGTVLLNGQPLAVGATGYLLPQDALSIDGVPVRVEWGDVSALDLSADETRSGATDARVPETDRITNSFADLDPEPLDEEFVFPTLSDADLRLPPPPRPPEVPTADRPTTAAFGFEAHEVEFTREGIGAAAASRLVQRFRPIKVLNAGGMGKVLLVQEVLSGRFVAMKIMLEKATGTQAAVQQFVREAVITARLQHPHIIPVHDLGFLDGDQLYYTMSYIEGETFKTRMPNMELSDRIRVIRCVALAAAHAHRQHLWHRDIKPQNILIGELGDTYLIDWGLVSVVPGRDYKLNIPKVVIDRLHMAIPDNLLSRTDQAMTSHALIGDQVVLGTPAYMAPETITLEGDHMGVVSDVWSLGIILFEALTGEHPLIRSGLPAGNVMERVRDEPIPAASAVASDVPPELDRLCARMLEKDPARRINDMKAVIDALTSYLKSNPHPTALTSVFAARPAAPAQQPTPLAIVPLPRPDPTATPPAVAGTTVRAPAPLIPGAPEPEPPDLIRAERDRYRAKCEILAELSRLGWFEFRRRRELWAKLAAL